MMMFNSYENYDDYTTDSKGVVHPFVSWIDEGDDIDNSEVAKALREYNRMNNREGRFIAISMLAIIFLFLFIIVIFKG